MRKFIKKNGVLLWEYLLKKSEYFAPSSTRGSYLATVIIAGLERYYQKYFCRFEKLLQKESIAVLKTKGLLFVMGALNAGGAERQAVLSLQGLQRRGLSPLSLLAFYLDSSANCFYRPHLLAQGIPVKVIPPALGVAPSALLQALPKRLRGIAPCIQALVAESPAVVHLWLDEINIKAGLAALIAGIPKIILSTRSVAPTQFLFYQPYMRAAYCFLARQPNVIMLNNSVQGALAYETWLGLAPGHIKVIYNGFDFSMPVLHDAAAFRLQHNIPLEAPLIGTVMRLSEEKRPLLWLDIAAKIHESLPETHFLIVGNGVLQQKVLAAIQQKKLGECVHYIAETEEPLMAIAALDLFLLTSRVEGLPNVLIEAQAMGIPVVTTDAGGAREVVLQGVTGWVLEHEGAESAAETMLHLLQDKAWRKVAAEQGPVHVHARFALERMLDETVAIYSQESVAV